MKPVLKTQSYLKSSESYISLGSNLGDRLQNLEQALQHIINKGYSILQISSVYQNPALLPASCLPSWNRPFLNAVIKIACPHKNPHKLLNCLQQIQIQMGRTKTLKWAPRIIDLDILLFADQVINTTDLIIPHPEITNRNFILAPFKQLNPLLIIPNQNFTVLELYRKLKIKIPTWMHILNITPDSFSDGGVLNINNFESTLQKISKQYIHIIDLGAESTRPGAVPILPNQEWQRLQPYIKTFFNVYKNKLFRPKLSIDTRYAQTAKKAISAGVDIINDVSGLSLEMQKLITITKVDYILMHNRGVPAALNNYLPTDKDPVDEIKKWLLKKIDILQKNNICLDRIIFDPGIGFGKNADQSLEILKRINEFYEFPVRIMVGHSRKSFMKTFSAEEPIKRDPQSAGISCFLVNKGVDILRVHNSDLHNRFLIGYQEVNNLIKGNRYDH